MQAYAGSAVRATWMAELDTWQKARQLIHLHGTKARFYAIRRSESARLDGDFMGYKTWKEVGANVLRLQRECARD